MIQLLKKLLGFGPPPPDHNDAILGTIRYESTNRYWTATPTAGPKIVFWIAGNETPNPRLLEHAKAVATNFDAFQGTVAAFLKEEASRFPSEAQGEIASLTIESLNLFWESRPDDGMIYFHGPNQNRVWRCDYIGRKPQGLGFDS